MSRCKLTISDRTVVESEGGPPEAELALFDPGNIELQSDAPGTIREIGYRTTVGDAKKRLEAYGVTLEVAREAAAAMQPVLAAAYARGAAARRVAELLGPVELFEGKTYDAAVRRYAGAWLDLQALALDVKMLRAATAMQALYLIALLSEKDERAPVFLSTLEHTRTRRPGERSYKRVPLDHAVNLPAALKALATAAHPVNPERASGAARADLLDDVSERLAACVDEAAKGHLEALARALSVREPPPRGPLADADLWALEAQMALGDANGVAEKIDAIEKGRGRLPATIYLRARAALMTGAEPPKTIAERMSALSQSMSQFFEPELLAAQAWLAAGDSKRAKAFAKDLVENPNAPDELRVKALELLDGPSRPALPLESKRAVPRTPQSEPTIKVPPRQKTAPSAEDAPKLDVHAEGTPRSISRPELEAVAQRRASRPEITIVAPKSSDSQTNVIAAAPARTPPKKTAPGVSDADDAAPDTAIDPAPIVAVTTAEDDEPTPRDTAAAPVSAPPPRPSVPPPRPSAAPPRPAKRPRTGNAERATEDAPRPTTQPLARPVPPRPRASEPPARPAVETNRIVTIERPASERGHERPAAQQPVIDVVTAQVIEEPPAPIAPPPAPSWPPAGPPLLAPSSPPPANPATTALALFARGGSQPPFMSEAPPPMMPVPIPRAAPLPRERPRTELAESLSLPPGLHGQPPPRDEVPRTTMDARIAFTWLSRELGRDYRLKQKIELRTDVTSIEAMQRHLRERFPDGQVKTAEDGFELRRHGAFLSEILARMLGAYWADIGPSELGYWAMIVPPQTRVWPFGRLLRFVTMGHKERDLVSYYLELESRARSG